MICPHCRKPYLFLASETPLSMKCLHCRKVAPYLEPSYQGYHAELYGKKKFLRNPQTDPQMKKILRSINIHDRERVLEIGCGVGDYVHAISMLTQHIIGVDRDTDEAKRRYPELSFQDLDCNNSLPFDTESFDVIVTVHTIEHLVSYTKFLQECHRLIKPGGRIAFVTANLNFFLHNFFYDQTHLHEWTLKEFCRIIQKFFIVDISEKSSGMFRYYPVNIFLTKFIKPDLLVIGRKA